MVILHYLGMIISFKNSLGRSARAPNDDSVRKLPFSRGGLARSHPDNTYLEQATQSCSQSRTDFSWQTFRRISLFHNSTHRPKALFGAMGLKADTGCNPNRALTNPVVCSWTFCISALCCMFCMSVLRIYTSCIYCACCMCWNYCASEC